MSFSFFLSYTCQVEKGREFSVLNIEKLFLRQNSQLTFVVGSG